MTFGLVVSPGNFPTKRELSALHVPFVRTILYRTVDLDQIASRGLPVLATINNQFALVKRDWSGWDRAMRTIAARRVRPWGVCVANELDLYYHHGETWLDPWFAADLVKRASAILRPAGILTIAPSVAGPDWQWYLEEMMNACRDEADYADAHFYGQRPSGWGTPGWFHGDLRVALCRAREIAGKPVIMSEYGVKLGDAGGEDAAASFLSAAARTVADLGPEVCPYAAWFAWRDQAGGPSERGDQAFGLVDETGRRRPAWQAFADLRA